MGTCIRPDVRRDYKNLCVQDQRRVNEAIRDIIDSDDPARLGRPKYGKWKGAYGYDVGRATRILYSVDSGESCDIPTIRPAFNLLTTSAVRASQIGAAAGFS